MIDVIIPTMWMAKNTLSSLEKYCGNSNINKVIIIDNAIGNRPVNANTVLSHPKINLVSYGKNIYVNPAWNEGFFRTTTDTIAIINDDVTVEDSVFDLVLSHKLKAGDLVGVNLRGRQDNYKIDDFIETEEKIVKLNYDRDSPIGGQAWAFGICMFMHRDTYKVIPSLYQIWYGDDYLAQHAETVYAINSNQIKGTISETLKKFTDPNDEISKRIELDSKNLIRYNHFHNSENWDIPRNMIEMYSRRRLEIQHNTQDANVFEVEYHKAKTTISDINQNLHILYDLAKECKTVIEMGVRTGVSTRAFLNTDVELLSFDIVKNPTVENLFTLAKSKGKKVQYVIDDVLNIEIPETDLIFIDTLHTYTQLKQELNLHGNKAKKYLVFHDTHTFGLRDEDGTGTKGLMSAIIEFLIDNPQWKFKIYKTHNNGMTVLERTK
jgi:hypothetical protein